MLINSSLVVSFDLDDTLYKEIDFVKSGFRHISNLLLNRIKFHIHDVMYEQFKNGNNPFDFIKINFLPDIDIKWLVHEYRFHKPDIALSENVLEFLIELKNNNIRTALITDGRSISQRNKINSLGIAKYIDLTIISEEIGSQKPSLINYLTVMNSFGNCEYFYIADNTKKDFLMPNKLSWKTIGILDDGRNIHKQNLNLNQEYLPQIWIKSFSELDREIQL